MMISGEQSDVVPCSRLPGALIWGAVLMAAALAWLAGFLFLPWWIALLIWWWPSCLVGGAAGFLSLVLVRGRHPARAGREHRQSLHPLRRPATSGSASQPREPG